MMKAIPDTQADVIPEDMEDVMKFLLRDDVMKYIDMKYDKTLAFTAHIEKLNDKKSRLQLELAEHRDAQRLALQSLVPLAVVNPVVHEALIRAYGVDASMAINRHQVKKIKKQRQSMNIFDDLQK